MIAAPAWACRSSQVGARPSRHPSGRISKPRAGFCAGPRTAFGNNNLNNLTIYETNTSNQSESPRGISVNRSQLSANSGRKNQRRSKDRQADWFPPTKQRFYRHRNGPRLRDGILSIYDYCPDFGVADLLEHRRNDPDGAGLLTEISSR